jgi:hypothetical protein
MKIYDLLRIIGGRLDEDVPPATYRAVSIDPEEYRVELSQRGLRFAKDGAPATVDDLDRSADAAIATTVRSAGVVGVASGMAGWLGVPPEAAARLVQSARLAQRLAVIYGHDPLTDRGQAHVHKALANAWGIELPNQTRADMKLSDIPSLFRSAKPTKGHGPTFMLTTLSTAALSTTKRRFTRLIPGLGAALGLLGARKLAREHGQVMKGILRAPHCHAGGGALEDAVVVDG